MGVCDACSCAYVRAYCFVGYYRAGALGNGVAMWQRFSLYDLRVIGYYLGTLVLFFSLVMAVPLVTAVLCGEWEPARRYLLGVGASVAIGAALRFLHIRPCHLNRQQALVVTGLAWIVLAFVASIPLWLSGHFVSYLDALFDCVSGLTTTGASIIIDLDHLSNADNMFRFAMHFVGGLGLIVIALSLGLFGKGASSSGLFSSEGRSEHVVPNVVQTTQFIAKTSVVIIAIATAVVMVLCLIIGMDPVRAFFHSLWLSISGFVTGGFAPMAQSVMYYHSFPMEIILMLLMIAGSISFVIIAAVGKGRIEMFFRDLEIRTMFLWLAVMTFVLAAALVGSTTFSDLPAMLRRGLFMAISAFSTTGFQIVTTNQLLACFTSGAFLVIAALMAVGGGAGSTAGGIKLMRVGIIAKSIVATVKEALSPDSARVVVTYQHSGRHVLRNETVKEVMTVFTLYIITYAVGALVGIAHGYEATQAIFESVAMTSNGGIITGVVAPDMPVSLELFYIFQMWAGRLEFISLFALIVKICVSVKPRRKPKRVS